MPVVAIAAAWVSWSWASVLSECPLGPLAGPGKTPYSVTNTLVSGSNPRLVNLVSKMDFSFFTAAGPGFSATPVPL
ncbi:hypothetical protein D3C81_1768550 [compost metagenome]